MCYGKALQNQGCGEHCCNDNAKGEKRDVFKFELCNAATKDEMFLNWKILLSSEKVKGKLDTACCATAHTHTFGKKWHQRENANVKFWCPVLKSTWKVSCSKSSCKNVCHCAVWSCCEIGCLHHPCHRQAWLQVWKNPESEQMVQVTHVWPPDERNCVCFCIPFYWEKLISFPDSKKMEWT